MNQVPIWLHLFSKDMQGGNFIYKKKKQIQQQNMYIFVEKQNSIKSKKQKHSPPLPGIFDNKLITSWDFLSPT